MTGASAMTGLRVVFRCDAGREDGLGHLMRSLVLADALAQRGAIVTFVTADGPEFIGAGRVAKRGFAARAAPGRVGAAADRVALADLWGCGGADLLVVDGKGADESYLAACRSLRPVLAIDDEVIGGKPVDLLVNNRVDASPQLYGDRPPGRSLLLGPSYNLVDPAYFAARRPTPDRVRRVLLTMGGEDPGNHTLWALEQIVVRRPDLAFDVVLGPAHPDAAAVRAAAKRAPHVALAEALAFLAPLVARADLAISAAGTTLFELAAAGVPALALVIEDHQRHTVDPLIAAGACALLGDHRSLDAAAARALFERAVSDAAFRCAMQRAQAALFSEPGAGRIADAVCALMTLRRSAA